MVITPRPNGFGASVAEMQPEALCAPRVARELWRALTHFQVLVLREASLDSGIFSQIARSMGELIKHDFVPGSIQDDAIHEIRKRPTDTHNFGGTWHSDGAYLARPPRAIMLQAIDVPRSGGDTLWACQYAAYANLSATLKNELRFSTVRHAAAPVFDGYADRASSHTAKVAEHPLFRWIPDRRQLAVFHSGPCTTSIVGLPENKSTSCLDEILQVASTARQFRHSWRPGDLVLWDNRTTLHMALNDYPGQSRQMRRAMIGPQAPRSAPSARSDLAALRHTVALANDPRA